MKSVLVVMGLVCLLSYKSTAQQIVDDGKVSRREFRLKSRQLPPKDRKIRRENWKYEQAIARAQMKEQRKQQRKNQKDIRVQRKFPVILGKRNKKAGKSVTYTKKDI